MVSKNSIIEKLARTRFVEKYQVKYNSYIPKHMKDDFSQFIYLTLLEFSDSVIINMNEKNELEYFVKYLIRLNATSPRSYFTYKIKKKFSEKGDDYDYDVVCDTYNNECEIDTDFCLYLYNLLEPHERIILDKHDQLGTNEKVSKALKISQNYIYSTIKKARNKIKDEINGKYI